MSGEICHHFSSRKFDRGFSLVELLVVLAIGAILVSLALPAIGGIKKSGDVDASANLVSGAINEARAYAMANDTYTWVGFYEESAGQNSTTPATPGTGRVVIDAVASADGTLPYSTSLASATSMSPSLIQISRLVRAQNTHLVSFPVTVNGTAVLSPGAVTIRPPIPALPPSETRRPAQPRSRPSPIR